MKTLGKASIMLPSHIIEKYDKMLRYAGKDKSARDYLMHTGGISLGALILSFVALHLYHILPLEFSFLTSVLVGAAIFALFYFYLLILVDLRAKVVERVLPDVLQLMSANVRGGMTVDRALWLCARPEFGLFQKELKRAAAETLGGKSLTSSLYSLTRRVKSEKLERSVRIMIQGIELGGELAPLLTEMANTLRGEQSLEREIDAATSMYALFIIFSSVIAAPLLFAVSTFYVETTTSMWSQQILELAGTPAFTFLPMAEVTITGEEVKIFAVACILLTTFFSALIIGLIRYGKAKRGVRYIPPFMIIAAFIYFGGYFIISNMFRGLIG